MWVRGLKPEDDKNIDIRIKSHPMWVRGLKLVIQNIVYHAPGRTPCGCVD